MDRALAWPVAVLHRSLKVMPDRNLAKKRPHYSGSNTIIYKGKRTISGRSACISVSGARKFIH